MRGDSGPEGCEAAGLARRRLPCHSGFPVSLVGAPGRPLGGQVGAGGPLGFLTGVAGGVAAPRARLLGVWGEAQWVRPCPIWGPQHTADTAPQKCLRGGRGPGCHRADIAGLIWAGGLAATLLVPPEPVRIQARILQSTGTVALRPAYRLLRGSFVLFLSQPQNIQP